MRLILITLSLIFSAHAVELSQASNQQILRELSKRLNSGTGTPDIAYLNAFCSGDDINIQLETLNSTENKVIDMRTSLECKNAVSLIKKGQFNGLIITAFCDSDLMYKIKASSSGTLNISSVDHRTNLECNESARNINRQ